MNQSVSCEPLLRCQASIMSTKRAIWRPRYSGDRAGRRPRGDAGGGGSSGSRQDHPAAPDGGAGQPFQRRRAVQGQDIHGWDSRTQARFRNQELGFVYQFHHLLSEFSALENAVMPLLIAGESVASATEKASKMLGRVGLSHRLNHRPSELSGGERQRVAIARALVNEPSLALADEPPATWIVPAPPPSELLCELNRELGTAFVVVTHD